MDNIETQLIWDIPDPAAKDVILEEPEMEKRAPVHAVAPDLKISEEALAEFGADLEEAKVTGAVAEQLEVSKAARLAAAQDKVDAAAKKDNTKTVAKGSKIKTAPEPAPERAENSNTDPDGSSAGKYDWATKATELKAAGVPILHNFQGQAKSYTLSAAEYHGMGENWDAGSISVL
ncbi:unnamed protein product [Symbiodinium necroappetens]|uniref:Uncharacterized protein n=1 Tax=Symbiodinium necroappetens TaxID=1628268 RepID=A0A812QK25_9DINO|nr:unnamed protein product [Symbiodinium necroappetens]